MPLKRISDDEIILSKTKLKLVDYQSYDKTAIIVKLFEKPFDDAFKKRLESLYDEITAAAIKPDGVINDTLKAIDGIFTDL